MGRSVGRFELSWSDDHGYHVSVPRLLEEGERLIVVPASEYDRLVAATEKFSDACDGYIDSLDAAPSGATPRLRERLRQARIELEEAMNV